MFGNRAIWVDGWKAVTLHANRMPWDVNVVLPFDQDEWELYHVAEDFSESTNLADTASRKARRTGRDLRRGSLEIQRLSAYTTI